MPEETLTAEQKLKEYEKMLDQIINAKVKKEGKVLAVSPEGFYKMRVGHEELICTSPKYKLKKGDNVMIIDGIVFQMLPQDLVTVEEEEIEFQKIGWDCVGGMKSQIESIRRKVEYPTRHASLFREFKLPLSKGILLHGPTGCGKTLIAKVIASSMIKSQNITKNLFIYLKGGELLSRYVGDAENRIKNVFDSARATYKKTSIRPVIFIDEAEAILPIRGSRMSSDVDTTIVPTFLSEMDGFEGHSPFVLLATNFEERLDPAILRPGRIDLKVYVGRPDEEDTADIFQIHLRKTKIAGDIHTMSVSAAKHLFTIQKLQGDISGALIENLVNSAIEFAIERKINQGAKKQVTGVIKADLINAINSK